jgi:hypothetical protein
MCSHMARNVKVGVIESACGRDERSDVYHEALDQVQLLDGAQRKSIFCRLWIGW